MPDTIIESVLNGKLDYTLLKKWLNNEAIEDAPDDCLLLCCTKSEFVSYFLTYLRNQTDSILQTNNAVQTIQNATPEKLLSTARVHRRSISEPTSDERTDSLSVKDSRSHNESPNRDKKRTGRKVKTKLFPDDKNNSNVSVSSDESRLSLGVDRVSISSTPIKNGLKPDATPSPITPRSYERCDTPRLSHRHSRSHEKSCLGDYLVTATKSSKKKTKKSISNDSETEKMDLDLSNSEIFPEIGARKSSSLRSEKKRIKPTIIDKSQKSLSLSSFNMECFQQPPLAMEENSAFTQQKFHPKESSNSFEVERSMLKQERHRLMEKFNILNTSTPAKAPVMPQIKITQKESIDIALSYVKADTAKILMKENLDLLIDIYDVLLKNNLILSINTEIYFLISLLVSKQIEDDYLNVEIELQNGNTEFLLKSIHNSTYFAVKSLWYQKVILEVILDKNSLKTLGENKLVRSFSPELAKSLLNCYCVRCEQPAPRPPPRAANVAYNAETDNVENFPTTHAFHLFKKQRDSFYDIVRWYTVSPPPTASRSSLRARVRALVGMGAAPSHGHLAALVIGHMTACCLPSDAQESKLSKLQRRLTCPTAAESNRQPHFTANEMFYKEFITSAESESFRVHLRDALASEIIVADSTHVAVDDRGNSNNLDLTREYLQLVKKLVLLAKFLGYLTSLPYTQMSSDISSKSSGNVISQLSNSREQNYAQPKEKVLENNIALRNYSQPTIDLKGLLQNACENSRISITIPWVVHYLSMLDYTTLRLRYYNDLIKNIYKIYYTKLRIKQTNLKKNTVIYLKSILGWLFDLSHFPTDENRFDSDEVTVGTSDGVDSCDLVDESTIIELCPSLKDINILLSTCRLSQEQKEMNTFRHITPVSLTVDPEDRIKNKEKELQTRLEEELIKSQPSSTRRVLEMVVERVAAAAVKEIAARDLASARRRARGLARRALVGVERTSLLQTITEIYTAELRSLRSEALASHRAPLASRARSALAALLPSAPRALQAAAARMAVRAVSTWLYDHTATTAILCKDIEAEMRTLISMNEVGAPFDSDAPRAPAVALPAPPAHTHESVATALIQLKEHACLILDGSPAPDVTSPLALASRAASPANECARAPAHRAIMQISLDLCLVYVSRKPEEINEPFLMKFHAVWNMCCPDRKHLTPEDELLPERRYEISPVLRNFDDDDERIATPISDEEDTKPGNGDENNQETKLVVVQPIATISQPIPTMSQPLPTKTQQIPTISQQIPTMSQQIPTISQIPTMSQQIPTMLQQIPTMSQPIPTMSQPINPKRQLNMAKLQPVNTKMVINSRSQPASPMLQPFVTMWPKQSKSQPVSPKMQTVTSQPTTPKWQPVTSQPTTPKWQPSSPTVQSESEVKENSESELLECFDRILCPRNIVLLNSSKCKKNDVWEAMATVLVFLLKNDYLSEDSLTEQCLAVYRQDWPQSFLESLSTCMRSVSSRRARAAGGKFTLFLDFLAEYCGDMDYDPLLD